MCRVGVLLPGEEGTYMVALCGNHGTKGGDVLVVCDFNIVDIAFNKVDFVSQIVKEHCAAGF